MLLRLRVSCLFIIGLAVPAGGLAAQGSRLTPQEKEEILAYQLTPDRANAILAAMDEMTRYLMSRPDVAEVMTRSMKMTRAELIAQMERDPQAMAIAKRHGLNAHDYTYGGPVLRMALIAAQGNAGPGILASPTNVAFAKEHLAELKPKLDAVDGIGRRR
jgi:hypothetical protein